MSNSTVASPVVNNLARSDGGRLVAIELNRRTGEVWFSFICDVCGKPILDPAMANVEWDANTEKRTRLGDGKSLLKTPVYVGHKDCLERLRFNSWRPLDAVLKVNQNQFDQIREEEKYQEFLAWKTERQEEARKKRRQEFDELAAVEPKLSALLAEAGAVKDDGKPKSFCANRHWYREFKPRLLNLVGWRRTDVPGLGTSRAYDVAYAVIYDALPACRDCGCF